MGEKVSEASLFASRKVKSSSRDSSQVQSSGTKSKELIHSFDGKTAETQTHAMKGLQIIIGVALLLGIGTGYIIASTKSPTTVSDKNGTTPGQAVSKGAIFGSPDEKTFKDQAEGTLKTGGIEGEGVYHLERPGGESQNVYLTSSSVDLSQFVGKKIKVWGQTQAAKHAGWLMDVGRLQVL